MEDSLAARIVLRGQVLEQARSIQDMTQISNLSEVISLLIARYADHFITTWKLPIAAVPDQPPATVQQFDPAPLPPLDF